MGKDSDTGEQTPLRTPYSAPALEKGFNVLELLAGNREGMTASEIAVGLGLSVSEIFRVIMVMERRGWLRKGAGDRYSVTPMVLALAFRATPAEEISAVALPHMREISETTDQSCHLVIRNRNSGLVIARLQNPGPTGFHVRVGAELNLETTCSGHILLAFGTEPYTHNPSFGSDAHFSALLHAVRQRGYARMESARTLGVTDISYPIFDMYGDVCAALTVPFLRFIDGTQLVSMDETQALLGETAKRISQELASRQTIETPNGQG